MGDTNWHPGLILVTKSLGRNKGETRHGSADSINPEETTTSSPRHQLKFNTLQDHWKRLMIHPPKNIVEHVLQLISKGVSEEHKVWKWMTGNRMKISGTLYRLRANRTGELLGGAQARTVGESAVANLPAIIDHPSLLTVVGSYLLQREDISYSPTLFNIAATFYYYSDSDQPTTFSLMSHVSASPLYLSLLTKNIPDITQSLSHILQRISDLNQQIRSLPRLDGFVERWIESFFYLVCQNGTLLKEKTITYLFLNNFDLRAISRVCEATFVALEGCLNPKNYKKCLTILSSPRDYLDKSLFLAYLLNQQQLEEVPR